MSSTIKKGVIKSVIEVTTSNATTIIAGVLVGFLLPKIISVDDYGYYKTFTLYSTYVGLFSLGIIDGIVLIYGGNDYDSLDRKLFRSYFRWYVFIHFVLAIIIFGISLFFLSDERRFILCSIAVFLVINNVTGFFQQISQITQRYREYSARKMILSFLNVTVLVVLFLIYNRGVDFGYRTYLCLWIGINLILTIWYIYTYRAIIFGGSFSLSDTKQAILGLICKGFPLLISNLCVIIIMTIDRQFVNILFNNVTYAVYAFAYNMLSLITVATTAIATVLYPTMKRSNTKKLEENYGKMISLILVFVFACIVIYFPLSSFIQWFLPQYSGSIVYFRIIFPGLSISSAVTVVMHNYYKVLGQNIRYFKRCMIVLVISMIANYVAYLVFKSATYISAASVISMFIWYILIDSFFYKEFNYSGFRNIMYLILMLMTFYCATSFAIGIYGAIVYVALFFIITFLFFHQHITSEKNNRATNGY